MKFIEYDAFKHQVVLVDMYNSKLNYCVGVVDSVEGSKEIVDTLFSKLNIHSIIKNNRYEYIELHDEKIQELAQQLENETKSKYPEYFI